MHQKIYRFRRPRLRLSAFGLVLVLSPLARATEHVTLRNGFELDCVRREAIGDKIRLYLAGSGAVSAGNYLEVSADSVVSVETTADLPEPTSMAKIPEPVAIGTAPTKEEIHQMLSHAGAEHNIDEDLLASVVRAESGGQVRAVSRTGAKGLMQLMPGTANAMGVDDAFQPQQNISGVSASRNFSAQSAETGHSWPRVRGQRNAGMTFAANNSRCVCAQRGGSPGGSVHE